VNAQAQAAVLAWQRTVDAAAARQQSVLSGAFAPAAGGSSQGPEFTAIQQYMYDEMAKNSKSSVVETLKWLNRLPMTKPQAYGMWAAMVRPGGPWDHKQRVLDMTEGDNTFTPVPNQGGRIRYDFWSNLHYGYVGIEAGFSPHELRLGADAADIVTRGETDPADDLAVRMGIELREKYPGAALQPHHIEQAIQAHRAELEKTGMLIP
jgi:hypothetical protein